MKSSVKRTDKNPNGPGSAESERGSGTRRVLLAGDLDAEVDRTVQAILKNSDAATRMQKSLQHAYEDLPLDEAIRESIDAFARSYESGEPQNLMRKFQAQRRR